MQKIAGRSPFIVPLLFGPVLLARMETAPWPQIEAMQNPGANNTGMDRSEAFWVNLSQLAFSQTQALRFLGLDLNPKPGWFRSPIRALPALQLDQVRGAVGDEGAQLLTDDAVAQNLRTVRKLLHSTPQVLSLVTHKCRIVPGDLPGSGGRASATTEGGAKRPPGHPAPSDHP